VSCAALGAGPVNGLTFRSNLGSRVAARDGNCRKDRLTPAASNGINTLHRLKAMASNGLNSRTGTA